MNHELLAKVKDGINRPQWSVLIPVYNAAGYLALTLQSVMQQDMGVQQMEIIVVDDCSTDDPKSVVDEYKGRVQYFRQPKNVGHTANFKTCLQLSTGKYIHLLHGDDIVYPGFYAAFEQLFNAYPQVMAAFCRCNFINEQGNITNTSASYQKDTAPFPNFFEQICKGQMIQTPTIVVKREVYESIGIFDNRLSWSEDWEMWARIGKHYTMGFVNEVLAGYRIHSHSNSGQYVLSGENIKDLKRAIHFITSYIDDKAKRQQAHTIAGAYYSQYAIDMANYLQSAGKIKGARNQVWNAFFLCNSPRVNLRLLKRYCKTFFST